MLPRQRFLCSLSVKGARVCRSYRDVATLTDSAVILFPRWDVQGVLVALGARIAICLVYYLVIVVDTVHHRRVLVAGEASSLVESEFPAGYLEIFAEYVLVSRLISPVSSPRSRLECRLSSMGSEFIAIPEDALSL